MNGRLIMASVLAMAGTTKGIFDYSSQFASSKGLDAKEIERARKRARKRKRKQ